MSDLEDALAEFAIVRSSVLSRVIEVLGRAAITGFTAPVPRQTAKFHELWLELVKKPERRTWCLDMFVEKLPKIGSGDYSNKQPALLQRVVALRDLAPDPRIVKAVLTLMSLRLPIVYGPVYDELARAIVQHADDETIAAPQLADFRFNRESQKIIEAATFPRPRPIDPEVEARWNSVLPAQRDPAQLQRDALAALDADGPREILADVLQDAGDIRGEFIALQVREARDEASDEMRARAGTLTHKHGKLWLGALRPIVLRGQFRRGFLHRIELAGAWKAKNWDILAQDPLLDSVEIVLPGDASSVVYSQFLRGRVARSVTTIAIEDDATWSTVKETAMPRLAEVRSLQWKGFRDYPVQFEKHLVPFFERTPGVTRVRCQLDMVPHLARISNRLTHLSIGSTAVPDLELWETFPRLQSVTFGGSDMPTELVRRGREMVVRIQAHNTNGLLPALALLPRTIERIEIVGNAKLAREIEQSSPRFQIISLPKPSGFITGAT